MQDLTPSPCVTPSPCAAAKNTGIQRVYWQTHETNAAGRLLYDKVAKHHGFIVYAHDV